MQLRRELLQLDNWYHTGTAHCSSRHPGFLNSSCYNVSVQRKEIRSFRRNPQATPGPGMEVRGDGTVECERDAVDTIGASSKASVNSLATSSKIDRRVIGGCPSPAIAAIKFPVGPNPVLENTTSVGTRGRAILSSTWAPRRHRATPGAARRRRDPGGRRHVCCRCSESRCSLTGLRRHLADQEPDREGQCTKAWHDHRLIR